MLRLLCSLIIISKLVLCVPADSSSTAYAKASATTEATSDSTDAASSAHAENYYSASSNDESQNENQKKVRCTGQNEVQGCQSSCPPQTCDAIDRQYTCPAQPYICEPACKCKSNYYRNINNICVSKKECGYENDVQAFSRSNRDFTEAFLYAASNMNPGASVIYSPFGLMFLLAQLALYATGISFDQLLSILVVNRCSIRSFTPQYLRDLNTQQNVTVNYAERVYVNYKYKLNKHFLRDTKNVFNSEAQSLDFSKNVEAANNINNWVANKTKNLIKDLVSPDSLSTDTRLVLANVIYFNGTWKKPFNIRNTREADFYVNKYKTVKVKMMNQVGVFKYADIPFLHIQAAELQYSNGNFSFLVLLPKSKDGLSELLEKVNNKSSSVIQDSINSLKNTHINLSIPSIQTTTTTDLGNVLQKLNVTAIFNPSTSGLSGLLEKPETLYVSSAVQKATITVNESGSEAAAGNAIVVTALSASVNPTITFKADHPFTYFILYDGTPLFGGIFAG